MSIYGLFLPKVALSSDEDFCLQQNKDSVFAWLRSLTSWMTALQTIKIARERPANRIFLYHELMPDYSEYEFYWSWAYGRLDVVVEAHSNQFIWPQKDKSVTVNEYRFHRGEFSGCSPSFVVWLTSQVDEAIKSFYPGIKQRGKISLCDSPLHTHATSSTCRQISDKWICRDCSNLLEKMSQKP